MLELREPLPRQMHLCKSTIELGDAQQPRYDEIVLDGQVIGICFKGRKIIHWTVPKAILAPTIIWHAVSLLQERNRRESACQEMGSFAATKS